MTDPNQEVSSELETQKVENASTPEEVLDTRSAAEVEAEFLKQAEDHARQIAENRDPAETAALMFHMFYPQFKNLTAGLSNKELRRLINAIIGKGHQSESDIPKFYTRETGQAYKLGLELMQAKFMMIQKLELDALEKHQQEKEAKELAAQAVITEERGEAALEKEETNG